ncbi:MAG: hypothetical protein KKF68_01140, partial [Nanoarchaeota archaeon]|nr:hypothetical protein [Nanoarchaeota archaeon]
MKYHENWTRTVAKSTWSCWTGFILGRAIAEGFEENYAKMATDFLYTIPNGILIGLIIKDLLEKGADVRMQLKLISMGLIDRYDLTKEKMRKLHFPKKSFKDLETALEEGFSLR